MNRIRHYLIQLACCRFNARLPLNRQLFFALSCCWGLALAQGGWLPHSSPVSSDLNRIFFVDEQSGWVVGENGTILHTGNGGDSWELQRSNQNFNIVDVFFLDNQLGWAVSWKNNRAPYGSNILSTTDGGASWVSKFYPEENITLRQIFFLDSLNGWVCGEKGTIAWTADGGKLWQRASLDTSMFAFFPVRDLQFFNRKYGYACGGSFDRAGMIWQTTDYGFNWRVMPLGPEPLQAIHILDSLNIIAVGGDFEYGSSIALTSDGGLSWEYNTLEGIDAFGIATAIRFRTPEEIWIPLSTGAKFVFSDNAGASWRSFPTPENSLVFDVVFNDSLSGFAVGTAGALFKYDQLVGTRIPALSPMPEMIELFQNYPNPFNPTTAISYQLSAVSNVRLVIYNSLGQQVKTLVSATQSAGRNTVQWDATDDLGQRVANGLYLYRIQAGAYVQVRKMLLLK